MDIITTPTSIFPLQYPKGDPSLPNAGAKAVPLNITMGADDWTVNLTILRQQKGFGPLRCIWIDTLDMTAPLLVCVDGTTQRFEVPAGTTGYYPVVVVNDPVVKFILNPYTSGSNYLRAVFLNFIPVVNPPLGSIGVNNFPSVQPISGNVGVNNFPLVQPISGNVDVNNFPSVQPISGNIGVNNFPSTLTYPGTTNTVVLLTSQKQLSLPVNTEIRSIRLVLIDVISSTGNNVFIADGSGTIVFTSYLIPFGTSTTIEYINFSNISIRLNNGTSYATCYIQNPITSGSIILSVTLY